MKSPNNKIIVFLQEVGSSCVGYAVDYESNEEKASLINTILFLFAKVGKNKKYMDNLIALFGTAIEGNMIDKFVLSISWQRIKWTSSVGTIWIGL